MSSALRIAPTLSLVALLAAPGVARQDDDRPNVLILSFDGLNEWISPLNDGLRGKPVIETPNLQRLAERGALFTNAHGVSGSGNGARASFTTGRLSDPESGDPREYDRRAGTFSVRTLPRHFFEAGYETYRAGRFSPQSGSGSHWTAVSDVEPSPTELRDTPPRNGLGYQADQDSFDWGVIGLETEELVDQRLARWAAGVVSEERDAPFFLGIGFHRPRTPWYLPSEWMSPSGPEATEGLVMDKKDLKDTPAISRTVAWARPGYALERRSNCDNALIRQAGKTLQGVTAYRSVVEYVDACVGLVLDALDAGPHANDTIVVLISDRGRHLGEKDSWRSDTLWEEATRVPLMIDVPDFPAGHRIATPVSLIDVYPTLCDLTGVGLPPHELGGRSLTPELRGSQGPEDAVALTVRKGNHVAVRDGRWRYIRYSDGSEELYDHESDPMELHNLAGSSDEAKAVQARLAARFDSLP